MELKVDENGHVVIEDGKPVYVHEDGKEIPFDAPAAMAKIEELNGEAKAHRLKAKELGEKLEPFTEALGEEDPKEWLANAQKAIDTVGNLNDKKLVDAGEVEALKKSIEDGYQKKLSEKDETLKAKDSQIYSLMVSSQFARSPFVLEKTVLPPEIAETYFGKHFKIEERDGEFVVVGYLDGNPVFSREKPGEVAPFEEAIQAIVDSRAKTPHSEAHS